MKPVKLFDDYLQMAADAANMSKEQYTATYLVPEKRTDINRFSPMAYAQYVLDGEMSVIDAAAESGIGIAGLVSLIQKIDKKFRFVIKEGDDHEVGMAQGQLEAIINAAMDLQEKIGAEEQDMPGWIQSHITTAYEYIKQANDNYHELKEGKKTILSPIIDTLTNSMEYTDETEFADMMSDYGYDFDIASEVFNAYWDLGAKDRLHYDDKDWTSFLKKHGVNESFDHLNELNLKSVGIKDFIKKVSDNKDVLQKLGFSKLKDLIGYIKYGSLEDWEEIRSEGAALGIVVEDNQTEVNEKMKVFMKNIIAKMIPAAFGASSSAHMREELKDAVAKAIEPILLKYDYVVESKESDALAKEIDKAMIKIDDSMSHEDFALAVGKILKDEYGSHNFGPFMKVLHKDLGI